MLRVALVAALVAVASCATLPESAQLTAAVAQQPTLEIALVRPLRRAPFRPVAELCPIETN